MENGIYHVRLLSERHSVKGEVVIRKDSVNGDVGGYLCQGFISVENDVLAGKILIKKWDHRAPPALGLFKEISITVTGQYDPKKQSFHFEGQANGHHVIRIQATGHLVASLI
jgi:hypothetical protein